MKTYVAPNLGTVKASSHRGAAKVFARRAARNAFGRTGSVTDVKCHSWALESTMWKYSAVLAGETRTRSVGITVQRIA